MINKNKKTTIQTSQVRLAKLAQHTSLVLMTLAATVGMVEVPEQHNQKVAIMPVQPTLAFATPGAENQEPNPVRREREETGPHYISYGVNQRTPGRTGRF